MFGWVVGIAWDDMVCSGGLSVNTKIKAVISLVYGDIEEVYAILIFLFNGEL